jgi:hypothetical protein
MNCLPSRALRRPGWRAARAELMFAEMELLSLDAEHDDILLKRKIFDTRLDGTEKTDEEIQEEITRETKYKPTTRKKRAGAKRKWRPP